MVSLLLDTIVCYKSMEQLLTNFKSPCNAFTQFNNDITSLDMIRTCVGVRVHEVDLMINRPMTEASPDMPAPYSHDTPNPE